MVQKQLVTCEMVKLESVLLYLKKKKKKVAFVGRNN